MERNITRSTDFEFLNYAQYAVIRRMVIEIKLKKSPDSWKKVFLSKVKTEDNGKTSFLTRSGKAYSVEEIEAISTPFGDYDSDAISCLCG